MEKREPSYIIEKNVSWGIQYRKTAWSFLKRLKFELLYNPRILLLGINENSKSKNIYASQYSQQNYSQSQDMEAT